ncbi:MAG: single-stranded-DNA-specific exonuclease RecJ, partial [Pygmaiobacter sp.]
LLKNITAAIDRIHQAVDAGERIAVFGDYDVDGVCATALLFLYLESIGAEVYYKLPSRADDGYGLSPTVIDLIASKGITLIVTVDNGVSAYEEVNYATSLGVDVIVTDHHLAPQTLPKAVAVIDPLQPEDESPCKTLAGVGVAFKLICAIEGCEPAELLPYYGDLVAIGTVADIMPLTGENRMMVRHGIDLLQQSERPGLRALLEVSGFANKSVTAENVSFALAPRINAAGRMNDANAALRMLLTDDEDEALALAQRLEEYNQERQKTEQDIVGSIVERIAHDDVLKNRRVIVVWGEGYHPGVIGIVASRLVERFGRPAIVLSLDGDEAKGSGRSVQGFSLYTAIAACKEVLVRYGGHDLAAGMSVKRENLERFSEMINEFSAREFPFIGATPITVDAPVELTRISTEDVAGLRLLA